MKTFFRLIALFLLTLFVILFPISLLMKNVGAILFNPETTKLVIQQNFLKPEAISKAIQGSLQNMIMEGGGEGSDFAPLLEKGLAGLNDQDWQEITLLIAPEALLRETTDSIIDAIVEWIDSDEALPDLSIDMQPWKQSIRQNAEPLVVIVLNALPRCTAAELGAQIYEGLTGDAGISSAIPVCLPPEPIYSTLLSNSNLFANSIVHNLPDQIDLSRMNIQGLDQLQRVKELLSQTRDILNWTWAIVLIMGFIGVAFGAREKIGWLIWSAWPLLISGLGTAFLSFGVAIFSGETFARLLNSLLQESPTIFTSLAVVVMAGVAESLAKPMLTQSFILLAFGLLALVMAGILRRREIGEYASQ